MLSLHSQVKNFFLMVEISSRKIQAHSFMFSVFTCHEEWVLLFAGFSFLCQDVFFFLKKMSTSSVLSQTNKEFVLGISAVVSQSAFALMRFFVSSVKHFLFLFLKKFVCPYWGKILMHIRRRFLCAKASSLSRNFPKKKRALKSALMPLKCPFWGSRPCYSA